jgi:hypothetical protein
VKGTYSIFLVAATALVLGVIPACTGGSMTHEPEEYQFVNNDWPSTGDTERIQKNSAFVLVPLDDHSAVRPDWARNFEVVPLDGKDGTTRVQIFAKDFVDVDYVLFQLNYDSGTYKPNRVEFTDFMGTAGEVVSLAITGYWKHVAVGIARTYYDRKPGVNGSGLICTVVFDNVPFGPHRYVAKDAQNPDNYAPTGAVNQVLLNVNTLGPVPEFDWFERNVGDGDNNGEVSVSDITPIALNYLDTLPNGSKPWLPIVDYDKNLEVSVSDITPIALYYLTNIKGYQVQTSPNGTTNWTPVAAGVTVTRSSVNSNPGTTNGFLHYTWQPAAAPENTTFYRVVPVGFDPATNSDDFGQPSNGVQVDATISLQSIRIELPADPNAIPLIITEASRVDPATAEPFARPQVQLTAWGTPITGGAEVDVTNQVLWDIELHQGTATVGNDAGTKGLVTGLDRGFARVRAMAADDFDVRATIEIPVMSCTEITMTTSTGSTGPVTTPLGTPVSFTAVATFDDSWDPDPGTDGDQTPPIGGVDITEYVGWMEVHETANPSAQFAFGAGGQLLTDDSNLTAGDWARVFCQYPAVQNPAIFFGYVATSNPVEVSLE